MEFTNILIQLFLFLILFYFGIPVNKIYLNKIQLNIIDNYILNTIFYINFFLLLSFFNLNIDELLISYLFLISIIFISNFKYFFLLIEKFKINFFLFSITFITLIIISVDISSSITLGWDSQKFWIYKTINFYNNGSIESLKYLDKGDGYDYPYLGSLLWAIYWKISFYNEEYFGRLFYGFLYILSLLSMINRLNGSNYSKIIIFLILVLLTYNYDYFGGDQDILLFSLVGFASSLIIKIFKIKNNKELIFNLFLLISLCNLMIWTKAEGSVYAFIIILSLVFFLNVKISFKFILTISLIGLMAVRIFVYKFYGLNIGVNSCCWNDLSLGGIYSKITYLRVYTIFEYFFYSFLKNYVIILSFLLLIISKNKIQFIIKNLYNYLIIFLCFGFIFSAYLLTDVNLVFMLKTGLDRLFFSITPFFIIIIINYLNINKLEFK
jgi:hypothetical protein